MFVISDKIKQRLEFLNISQAELSDMVETLPATISNLVNNKMKMIPLDLLYKVCKVLNLSIEQVIVDNKKIDKEKLYPTQQQLIIEIKELSYELSEKISQLEYVKNVYDKNN